MLQNLSSAAVVIGALRVNVISGFPQDSAIKTIEETHEQWKRLVVSKEAECDAICW